MSTERDVIAAAFGELVGVRRWVAWKEERRGDDVTKVPVDPGTGRRAKSNDPASWGTLEEAEYLRDEAGLAGVGIVLGDGLGGVDLDACRDPETGDIASWARRIIEGFGTYAEVSPSGTGVKLYALGAPAELPGHVVPIEGAPLLNGKRPQIEVYTGGRYFAVTGDILAGSPDEIIDCGGLGEGWGRLVRTLRERAPSTKASPVGDEIPSGGRNQTLTSLAGTMRRRGMAEAEILAALRATNEGRCRPPLDDGEVQGIAASVSRYEPGETDAAQRDGDPPEDHPEELPEPVLALGAERPPPPSFSVEGLLLERELHLLGSDGGVGKTTFLLAVGGAYANGAPVFDSDAFSVPSGGGDVLFVSEEDGLGVLLDRLEALIAGHAWDREKVLGRTHLFAQAGATLDAPEWREHLLETATRLHRPFVFLDPLAELTIASENSNDEAKGAIRFLRRLTTEAEATVVLSLHAGKRYEGQRKIDRAVRGASAWYSAARGVYHLERSELGVSVECLKMSRAKPPSRFVLQREIESKPGNTAAWTRARLFYLEETAADDLAAERFVIELLDRHPGSNSTAIRDAAKAAEGGPSQFDISRAIQTLEAVGRIEYESGPRNAKLWKLRDPAETAGQGTLPTLPDPARQAAKDSSDDPADPSLEGAGSGSHSVDARQGRQGGKVGRAVDDLLEAEEVRP